jgi:LacI family transcriptional regulator
MKNTATLKKISDHLSISISTVSRALKDHPDVAPETKRRVKELAAMLDYEPNAFAVNLRKKHSNVFAVVVPEISNYFYHSFIQAVEEDARRMGYTLMILQSMNDPDVEEQNLRLCRHNHVAGVFVALTSRTTNMQPFKKLETLDIPLVFFDKVPVDDTFNKVSIADYDTGRLAAELLLKHRKAPVLAIFGNPHLSITQRREKGFTDVCREAGTLSKLTICYAEHADEAVQHTVQYFQMNNKTFASIFSMSDEIMCGVLKGLNQLQMKLPDNAALLTISNGFLPTLFSPEIAFVKTSGYDLGKLSFSRMMEIKSGKTFVRENFLASTYIPGGSL